MNGSRRLLAVGLVGLLSAASAVVAPPVGPAGAAPAAPAAPAVVPPAIDPGVLGPNPVDELAYDLGDEAFQPEGFPGEVELRGRVYAPQSITGRAPVVVIVHGRHVTCGADDDHLSLEWPCRPGTPEIPSYQGYDALGENLASHGIVAVSIGANGVNGNDGFVDDGGASARAQLVLESLRRFQAWDASAAGSPFGSRFVGHLDLTDVGLMGHSRGGEGVVAAAELNQRIGSPFGIRAVLALAPVDFARRVLGSVALGVVLPYCDGDVSDLQGASFYDDARYAYPGDPAARSTTLVYGANHNYFNTVWTTGVGASDDADYLGGGIPIDDAPAEPAGACSSGAPGRLSGPAQEQAGEVIMAGFLRRHLLDDAGLQRFVTGTAPFPASVGVARWSSAYHAPDRLDLERWDTAASYRVNRAGRVVPLTAASSGLVCNPYAGFGDGVGPVGRSAMACPSGELLGATNDTGILDVGWTRPTAVVRQELAPAGTDVTAYDGLRFRVAVGDDSRNQARARQDLTVVLEDAAGNRASVAAGTAGNALIHLNPGPPLHSVLNGVRIPLESFPGVDLAHLRAVELRFDRTNAGRLQLADLALTAEGTGAAVGPTTGAVPVSGPRPVCRRSAAARWACTVGQVLVGRDLDTSEVYGLSLRYGTAAGRSQAIAGLLRGPSAARLHQNRFAERYVQADVDQQSLDYVVSPKGRAAWETGLVEISRGLAFSTTSLGTPARQVQALYQSFTGRPADAAAVAYWEPRVAGGDVSALAAALVRTTAYRGRVVDERYRQVLGRDADPSGRAHWVAKLATPGGEQAMLQSLMTSQAFLTAASG